MEAREFQRTIRACWTTGMFATPHSRSISASSYALSGPFALVMIGVCRPRGNPPRRSSRRATSVARLGLQCRRQWSRRGKGQRLIDLHCHLLPDIDDGAPDLATAMEMARLSVADGVRVIACTPHIFPGVYSNTGPDIR